MKNIYTLLFLLFTILGFSQDSEERIERIKALRIAFISEKLELTPEEAQQFWPIFNQFDNRQSKLQREKRKLMRNLRSGNTMNLSEKETAKLMEEDERLENEIQNNRRQLVKDLQGVIPNRKILMLRQIDIEFKQKLLQQIQKRQERRYKR